MFNEENSVDQSWNRCEWSGPCNVVDQWYLNDLSGRKCTLVCIRNKDIHCGVFMKRMIHHINQLCPCMLSNNLVYVILFFFCNISQISVCCRSVWSMNLSGTAESVRWTVLKSCTIQPQRTLHSIQLFWPPYTLNEFISLYTLSSLILHLQN